MLETPTWPLSLSLHQLRTAAHRLVLLHSSANPSHFLRAILTDSCESRAIVGALSVYFHGTNPARTSIILMLLSTVGDWVNLSPVISHQSSPRNCLRELTNERNGANHSRVTSYGSERPFPFLDGASQSCRGCRLTFLPLCDDASVMVFITSVRTLLLSILAISYNTLVSAYLVLSKTWVSDPLRCWPMNGPFHPQR